ncbi:hypothetical protein [Blastococcus sp. CT_GayMR16]|uniref:hypothetical protein n=1 Tax=Blastococcus sp. CT_GayMR16 TaxID=2559607 RepID=UPI0010732D1D|nr:hypothetical protein [Blastococcus sp. CT_GayMR16]TFV91386.1 hypothetical protein E4P38_02020 [Blastococcus sp. CT_GayMR16]
MTDLLADVDAWCRSTLPPRRPTHLLNVRPTDAQLDTHPESLAIAAYFAGARHATGEPLAAFPRPLTAAEAECWRDGWAEHQELPLALPEPQHDRSVDVDHPIGRTA